MANDNLTTIYDFNDPSLQKNDWANDYTITRPQVIQGNFNARSGRCIANFTTNSHVYGNDLRSMCSKTFHGDNRIIIKPKTDYDRYKRWADAFPSYPSPGIINRARIWYWAGSGISLHADYPGKFHFHIGTYIIHSDVLRADNTTRDQETDNGHFYHSYTNLITEQWQQLIIDDRPTHQRTASDSAKTDAELDALRIPYPEIDPNHGYFDQLTTTYFGGINEGRWTGAYPKHCFFSALEAYRDTSGEDNTHCSNPSGVFDKNTQTFALGWHARIEHAETAVYRIRWSHSPVQGQNWEDLTPVVNNPEDATFWNGQLRKAWYSVPGDIPTGQTVYFALRSEEQPAGAFRQFICPVTDVRPPI